MRIYKNKGANLLYLFYRLISPVINPIRAWEGLRGIVWFIRDIVSYHRAARDEKIISSNLFPILDEKVSYTPFDAHYFYQQIWAFSRIQSAQPKKHIDVASTYELSGYLSTIVPTTFIDLRPIKSQLAGLTIEKGDILNLPYEANSVKSISCLHVIEHIGLGRYGDPLDPKGTEKACVELTRVLAQNGDLYISTPIGRPRTCFNAHRIHDPRRILQFFSKLTLKEFSVVDDDGLYIQNATLQNYTHADYACGMFIFTKLK